MPITVRSTNPKEDIWTFFTNWLALLKGPYPDEAFKFIDGCDRDCYKFDSKNFADFLKTFSGDPKEYYGYEDIVLDGELFQDCKNKSQVHRHDDGSYYALLDMPLKTCMARQPVHGSHHRLVVGFYLVPKSGDAFEVYLHIDDNVVIL